MAIVIDTGTPTDQTYAFLLSEIAQWMNRTDLGAVIPRFVALAESRIARDLRVRKQLTTTVLSASVTTRAISLPTDWLELKNLTLSGNPFSPLQFMSMDQLDAKYPEGGCSGQPFVYSIEGDNLILGPLPDSAYSVETVYYARFPALATSGSNWLYSNHPQIYLYACLREGAMFVKDAASAAQWDGLFKNEVKSLQDQDDEATHSGSALRVKYL